MADCSAVITCLKSCPWLLLGSGCPSVIKSGNCPNLVKKEGVLSDTYCGSSCYIVVTVLHERPVYEENGEIRRTRQKGSLQLAAHTTTTAIARKSEQQLDLLINGVLSKLL